MLHLSTSSVTLPPTSPQPLPPPPLHLPLLIPRLPPARLQILDPSSQTPTATPPSQILHTTALLDATPVTLLHTTSNNSRFQLSRETRRLHMLRHPNIVMLYGVVDDVGGVDGTGVVVEFMEGTLEDFKAELKREEVVAVFESVCSAMSFLHDRGYCHGDVRMENVWVERREDGGVVAKLAGFGMCRRVETRGEVVDSGSVVSGDWGREEGESVDQGCEKDVGCLIEMWRECVERCGWREGEMLAKMWQKERLSAEELGARLQKIETDLEIEIDEVRDIEDEPDHSGDTSNEGERGAGADGHQNSNVGDDGEREDEENIDVEGGNDGEPDVVIGTYEEGEESEHEEETQLIDDTNIIHTSTEAFDDDTEIGQDLSSEDEVEEDVSDAEDDDHVTTVESIDEEHDMREDIVEGKREGEHDENLPEEDAGEAMGREKDPVMRQEEDEGQKELDKDETSEIGEVQPIEVAESEHEENDEVQGEEMSALKHVTDENTDHEMKFEEDDEMEDEVVMVVDDEEEDEIQPLRRPLSDEIIARQRSSIDGMAIPGEGSVAGDYVEVEVQRMRSDLMPNDSVVSEARVLEGDDIEPIEQPEEDYEFKDLVEARDYEELLLRATDNDEPVSTTVNLVKALELLLEMDDYEECMIRYSGVYTLVSIMSRHGRHSSALCASVCRCYVRLANRASEVIERELRSNPVVNGALEAISWHPTSVPSMLAASMAIAALASASEPLCSQVIALDGRAKLHRALSRAVSTFGYDVPLTTAALDGIESVASMIPQAVSDDGSAQEVLNICRRFFMEREDYEVTEVSNKCLRVLAKITATPQGVKSFLDAGGIPIVTAAMEREAKSVDTLRSGCDIIRKVVREEQEKVAATFADANVVKVLRISVRRGGEAQDFSLGCRLAGGAMRVLRYVCAICNNLCSEIESSDTIRMVTEAMIARQEHSEVVKEGAVLIKEILTRKQPKNREELADRYMDVLGMLETVQARWLRNTDVSIAIKESIDAVKGIEKGTHVKKTSLPAKIKNRFRRR